MSLFVVIGALLALLTVALLTRPLWRRSARDAATRLDSPTVATLRQQLEQLAALNRSGALGDKQFSQARQALERRIVEAVTAASQSTAADLPAMPKALLLGLAGFVCAVAVAGYAALGTPQALGVAAAASATTPSGNGHSVTAEQIDAMIDALAARLKDKPDDADGWAMLGRSLAALGRHEQAMPALQRAVALRGDDAVLLTDYADALAVVNGRSLEGEPSRLIEQALKLDPNNLKALALAGTLAFNRKDYAGAVRHWEKLAQLAPGSELGQQIQGGIDEARRLAGGAAPVAVTAAAAATAAPAAPAAAPPPALPGTSVSGTVTLTPALAAKARPDDTVFVFARAAEGPRMPLAILRKQVKDLPLSFTLDDSMAMTPTMRLSSTPRVVVGARVSARGDATPQPGDLQGFSAPVAPGAAGLKIQISEVIAAP
jgi:cytochrome c-type biogenesis protein CcmH